MTSASRPMLASADKVLAMTRDFDAPVRLVYEVWTQPAHIRRWWGPRGFTTLSCELDLRPGGHWRVESLSPEGTRHTEVGSFREVVPMKRLVLTHAWERVDGTHGHETLVTITFARHGNRTRVDFHQAVFDSVESRDGHEQGWGSAFELLVDYLAEIRA